MADAAESKTWRSLSDGLGGRDNALGIIRLVLASAVVFSHAFPLGGWGEDPVLGLTRGQENLGGVAVLGFFAISGYLITKSGANSDILQFMWHRFLRIFPAFWVVLLVAAAIVGPIVWLMEGGAIRAYAHRGAGGPIGYLLANWNLSIGQYGIFDIFAGTTPYGEAVGTSVFNGSLWTLSYEWICYLIIGVMVVGGVLVRARVLVPVLTAFFFLLQVMRLVDPAAPGQILPFFADPYRVSLPLIFLFGACLAVYSKKIPLDDRLGILSSIVAVLSLGFGGLGVVGYPAIAYCMLWAAARLPAVLRKVGAKNDYSYGIYVYGFLVEQVLAYLGVQAFGYVPFAVLALGITVACAWVSWHVIEKPALSLKDKGPGRGITHWSDGVSGLMRRAKREALDGVS
ncbi:MAG TPA: acyltransferase [Glaciibacter sp.]|nr:acyltransferase [Glaciibacter sp.]